MKLINKDKEFLLTYGGNDVNVPEGEFTAADNLAHHIISIATKWGKDVQIVNEKEQIEQIKKEIKEEVKEEEEEKPKKTTKNKTK